MSNAAYAIFECSIDSEPAATKEVTAQTPRDAARAYKANLPKEIKPGNISVHDKQGEVKMFSWDLEEMDPVTWLEQETLKPKPPPPPEPTKEVLEEIAWLEQETLKKK